MAKVKIEGKGFKPFMVELKDLNLSERSEINDIIFDPDSKKNFSFWLEVIKRGTDLGDDEVNKYSNDQIFSLGSRIITEMNKKKL